MPAVLLRVQAHPASRIDQLLPQSWAPLRRSRRPEQVGGAPEHLEEHQPARARAREQYGNTLPRGPSYPLDMPDPSLTLRTRRSWPRDVVLVLTVLGLGVVVGGVFFAEYVSEQRARQALLEVVATSSGVRLNGQSVDDLSVLLRTLRLIVHMPAHHSSPTSPIRVDLIDGGKTTGIVVARDSARASEFWVYRPGPNWHREPLGQEAGRITSPELDEYLRRKGL